MSDYTPDLSAGTKKFIQAIKTSYPKLSNQEVERLGNILLNEYSERLLSGEKPAFLKKYSDGRVELTVIGLKIIERNSR